MTEGISFVELLGEIFSNPLLLITFVLTNGVIFVNGWTDAPNAIATSISTRSIRVDRAVLMGAIFNFLGVLVVTTLNSSVAFTISNMVSFGDNSHEALIALCAALTAIVVWAVGAWFFGIPTSESHALIAGLSGAAVAINNGFSGINGQEWLKVIYGLLISTVLGFFMGYLVCKAVVLVFQDKPLSKANKFFEKAQVFGGASMAFMHGAQDGQKFIGVLLLGVFLSRGLEPGGATQIPIWMMIMCSVIMGLGTAVGGKKIIKAVGMDMVKLKKYQGFSSDLAAALCLLLSTLFGIPVSTTHMKTAAVMGAGAERRLSAINLGVVKDMVLTWVCTFPGCGLIGYLVTKLFLAIF